MRSCRTSPSIPNRRGFLLVVVMVVIIMASLTCYQFAERMTTEREIASIYKSEAQALQSAQSGVDFVLAWLTDPEMDPSELPGMLAEDYAWQMVQAGKEDAEVPNDLMCVFLSPEATIQNGALTFGIGSEGGKINLNALAELDVPLEDQRGVLMMLPNMTESLADTILDFIDADAEPRDYGTESDDGDLIIRNAPLTSLDDLLGIPEITPDMLYGEDANRNGRLDPSEDDGELREPIDNADGLLDLGWEQYLTLWSRETNLRTDASPKIDLNAEDLTQLEADLTTEFGEEFAQFVVMYRQNGPQQSAGNENNPGQPQPQPQREQPGARGPQPAPGGGGRNNSNSGIGTGTVITARENPGNVSDQGENNIPNNNPPNMMDDGNAGASGQYVIQSPYELIDAVVETEDETIQSPWTSDDLSYIQMAEDLLTTVSTPTRPGRIDMNHATYEALAGLPEISEALINEILDGAGTWTSPAELLQNGNIDVAGLVQLEPFLTAQSRTYRFVSTGFWKSGGPVVRIEVVVDIAGTEPVILRHRNLTPLGPGYSVSELMLTEEVE